MSTNKLSKEPEQTGSGDPDVPDGSPSSPRSFRRNSDRVQTLLLAAALIVLPIVFVSLNSRYLSAGNIDSMLRQTSILLLIVAAETGPILLGSIDLSIGAIASLSAVVAGLLSQHLGQPAIFLVLLLGLLVGLLNGVIVSYVKLPSFLVTLGTSFAFAGAALLASGGFPVQLAGSSLNRAFVQNISVIPLPLIYAAVAWFALIVFFRRTATGRYGYAIGGNERAARLLGVNVPLVKTVIFGLTGLFCAMAGILLLFSTTAATPDIGSTFLLPAIAAIVMGGTPLSGGQGGVGRGLIGTLILVELTNGMFIIGLGPATQQIVQGFVVILAVLLTFDRRRLDIVK